MYTPPQSSGPVAIGSLVSVCHQSFGAVTLGTSIRAALILTLFLFSRYLLSWLRFTFGPVAKGDYKVPTTVPYVFPFLCSTVNFVWNPLGFIRWATFRDGGHVPVRVKIVGGEVFLVQGQEHILSLFKQTAASTATYMHMFCLKNLFGMHAKPLSIYEADDSGDRAEPYPESTTAPHNRIDFLTHASLVKFLSGPSLSRLFERFNRKLADRFTTLAVGFEWKEIPDFLNFIQIELGMAVLEAMMGPHFLPQNPTFVADLFKYDTAMPTLSKGLPRFMDPSAYAARDRMLFMIKRWYTYAQEHFDEGLVSPDGDFDPFWGSEHMRYRQKVLRNVDGFDDDAIASSDLGLIWGTITNAIPCTFWALVHIYRDPVLLSEVRTELRSSIRLAIASPTQRITEPEPRPSKLLASKNNQTVTHPSLKDIFSISSLLEQPLLQSIYAETLRLYVRGYITRSPSRSSLLINDYVFPQNSVLLASSDPAHFDSLVWNTCDGAYPLSSFWGSRFVVRRDDPDSGPILRASKGKSRPQSKSSAAPAALADAEAPAKFSLDGLNGAWIPYGGGFRACPGRHFAKREILMTCAMMLAAFDVDILAGEQDLKLQEGRYGLGSQKPVGKITAKIKRRQDPI